MFTAIDYLTALATYPKYEKSFWDWPLQYVVQKNTSCSQGFHRSHYFIQQYAKQALESGLFPVDTVILCNTKVSAWRLNQGKVTKEHNRKIFCMMLKDGVPSIEVFDNKANFWKNYPQCSYELKSKNFPNLPYPGVFSETDIVRYFRDVFRESAPILAQLKNYSWRFESLPCYSAQKIEWAIAEMRSKGFLVEIQEPYVIVYGQKGDEELILKQPMVVTIPKDASVANNAVMEWHPTYKEELSLHNVLVAEKDHLEKMEIPFKEDSTIDEELAKICDQLKVVASIHPMTNRFAYDIALLRENKCQELIKRLQGLCFTATLGEPFIIEKFVGLVNGINATCLRRYVFIDLPQQ